MMGFKIYFEKEDRDNLEKFIEFEKLFNIVINIE